MGIVALLSFIILEVILVIFAVSIFRSRTAVQDSKRSFTMFLASLGVWSACNYFSNASLIFNHDALFIINQVLFACSAAIIVSAIYFIDAVLMTSDKMLNRIVLSAGSLAFVLSFTPFVVNDIHLGPFSVAVVFGSLAWLYFVAIIAVLCIAFHKLSQGLASSVRRIHEYARVLFVSIGGVALALLVTNIIAPVVYHNFEITTIGPFLTVGIIVGVAYAIVRHGLFDIRLAVVRSIAYSLVLAVMVGLYFGLAYVSSLIIHNPIDGTGTIVIYAGISVLLAILFQPIKQFFDRITNRIFYKENYISDDFYFNISRHVGRSTDLHELLTYVSAEIDKTLKPEQTFFSVYNKNSVQVVVGVGRHKKLALHDSRQLDKYISLNGHAIILTELLSQEEAIHDMLTKLRIALVMPLMSGEAVMGYLCLGERRSGDYTTRDMKTLRTVSGELAIAIQNALSIQDVEEINMTLQQRIEDATKELRRTNAQLQRLDTAKDEFISMASHQLRTPLTSVKGYISMVLEGDAGNITDMQHKLLSEAFVSSERMVHLISDFLNVSRLQTGKFMLEQHAVDLAKITAQEVEGLQTIAKSHDLKLKFKAGARTPILYIDEGKIRQVIMNFIDNAIYYSREFTTIIISVSVDAGDVLLQVQDTGIGVPESEQLHLFTKFFRATNARKQRPDGTGVGLFLAKKVITAHGGSVVFHSTEGEGSTFGFRLPIKKLQSAPADQTDNL